MAVQAKVMTEQEKKQRIAALRAELKELQATPRSDWHTAFEAFLRFKTYRYNISFPNRRTIEKPRSSAD